MRPALVALQCLLCVGCGDTPPLDTGSLRYHQAIELAPGGPHRPPVFAMSGGTIATPEELSCQDSSGPGGQDCGIEVLDLIDGAYQRTGFILETDLLDAELMAASNDTVLVGVAPIAADHIVFFYERAEVEWRHVHTVEIASLSAIAIHDDFAVIVGSDLDADPRVGMVTIVERIDGEWINSQVVRSAAEVVGFGRGGAVSVDGGTFVVGDADAQAAHVFEQTTGAWRETAKLELLGGDGFLSQFGRSVAVSGDRIAIGAPGVGSADLYERVSDGEWVAAGRVFAFLGYEAGSFGTAVALHESVLVVGAPTEAGPAGGSLEFIPAFDRPTTETRGAAYVFRVEDGVWQGRYRVAVPGASYLGHRVAIDAERLSVADLEMIHVWNYLFVHDVDPAN